LVFRKFSNRNNFLKINHANNKVNLVACRKILISHNKTIKSILLQYHLLLNLFLLQDLSEFIFSACNLKVRFLLHPSPFRFEAFCSSFYSPPRMPHPLKIAVIGSGISGLAVAHSLVGHAEVTLYEAADYFGGHTHTVDVTLPTAQGVTTHGVDTGFLVYNERTYPNLIALFAQLGVQTVKSDMSFSVQAPGAKADETLEWGGSNLASVFAQRSNLWNPRFLGMLWDLMRFNKLCTAIASTGSEEQMAQPLQAFLAEHRFSESFCHWYLLPMLGCIWSCPTDQMLLFPVASMIRFCHNHGLMQVRNRPQWYTVYGGARHYVDKIVASIADKRLNTPVKMIERDAAGVRVITARRAERFDKVVIATHAPQALTLLRDASPAERVVLGALRTQTNRLILHTDASVLPRQRSAWSAWNYVRGDAAQEGSRVCLHYLLNKLQPLPFTQPVIASLNPSRAIAHSHILGEYDYAHPILDIGAIAAQARVAELQGQRHTYYCGAWTGYGFHEDGLKSGLGVARQLLQAMHMPLQEAA
jgi:uncharacterized protein